jgi:hypothetical protein
VVPVEGAVELREEKIFRVLANKQAASLKAWKTRSKPLNRQQLLKRRGFTFLTF